MTQVVILHGTKGSPEGNWFRWLECQLTDLGLSVGVPRLPTPKDQSLKNWLAAFKEQVGSIEDDTILIGHSAGAAFAMRLVEHFAVPTGAVVLVAGLFAEIGNPEYDELNRTFIGEPFKWPKIKELCSELLVVASDNDPYVPFAQTQQLAVNLSVRPYLITNGGHLNAEFGFTEFPELLQVMRDAKLF